VFFSVAEVIASLPVVQGFPFLSYSDVVIV